MSERRSPRSRTVARSGLLAVALVAAGTAGCSDEVDSPSVTNEVLAPAGTGEGLDRGEVEEPLDDDVTGG